MVMTIPASGNPLHVSACLGQARRWCEQWSDGIEGEEEEEEEEGDITLEAVMHGLRFPTWICPSDKKHQTPWACDIESPVKFALDAPPPHATSGAHQEKNEVSENISVEITIDLMPKGGPSSCSAAAVGILSFNVWTVGGSSGKGGGGGSVGGRGPSQLLESVPILLLPSDCQVAAQELSEHLSSQPLTQETLDLFSDLAFVLEGAQKPP